MSLGGLNVNPSDVNAAINGLQSSWRSLSTNNQFQTLLGPIAFSTVSGLDQAGKTHSGILDNNAIASQKAFADRFANASNTLSTNLADFVEGDEIISRSFSQLGFQHDAGALLASMRSGGAMKNTDTEFFHASLPAVGRPASLMALCGQFSGTNFGIPASMTSDWTSLAATINEAALSLDGVLADLESSSETAAISEAIGNITRIRNTGLAFAANAGLMSGHTASLGTHSMALGAQTASVGATYQALRMIRPDAAKILEQTYLNAFPGLAAAALTPSVPVITQLLPGMNDPMGTAAALGPEAPRVPSPADIVLPAAIQEAMVAMGYGDAARMRDPEALASEYQQLGPERMEQILAGHAPTTTASTAMSMPPALNPGGLAGSGLGGTLPVGTGTAGAGGFGPGGIAGLGPVGLGGSGVGNGGASGAGAGGKAGGQAAGVKAAGSGIPGGFSGIGAGTRAGGAGRGGSLGSLGSPVSIGSAQSGSRGNAGLGVGRNGIGQGVAPGGMVRMPGGAGGSGALGGAAGSGVGGRGAGGFGSGMGSGTGAGQGTSAHGSNPHGSNPHGTGRGGTAYGVAAGGSGGSSASNGKSAHSRGFMPAMMAPGARGGNGTGGSVKKVTSAVEREGNLKSLLGPGPEVIPGVIGAWVREPHHAR